MSLNAVLDRLPRATFGRYTRPVPAFRTCGVVGFYAAVLVTFGTGLWAGGSPLVLALACLVAGSSFFGWALLRRRVTGAETLVLLEHVWVAEACVLGALVAVGVSPLRYLDSLAVGLCVFLAAGRVGCTLVGCCHGRPSSNGIRYGPELVREGFTPEYEGVRLLPVPALEAVALLAIGLTGALAIGAMPPGTVFVWFLVAYAVVRFGLEGLRGDERPHVLGLSVNRWMCVGELALALWLGQREVGLAVSGAAAVGIVATLGATLVATLLALRLRDRERTVLRTEHLEEVRTLVRELATAGETLAPALGTTSRGVAVGVSRAHGGAETLHVSLSLQRADLELSCRVAAGALPELDPSTATATPQLVLHLLLPEIGAPARPTRSAALARALYGAVVRRLQDPVAAEKGRPPARADYFGGARTDLRAAS
ncbi:MAG: prolipoprotein diacylglyceryl transferase [Actinomycetota bacterium]|nr:prolipoprotein diacylglyceryl transferase [Actinomycetota bacterium]